MTIGRPRGPTSNGVQCPHRQDAWSRATTPAACGRSLAVARRPPGSNPGRPNPGSRNRGRLPQLAGTMGAGVDTAAVEAHPASAAAVEVVVVDAAPVVAAVVDSAQ